MGGLSGALSLLAPSPCPVLRSLSSVAAHLLNCNKTIWHRLDSSCGFANHSPRSCPPGMPPCCPVRQDHCTQGGHWTGRTAMSLTVRRADMDRWMPQARMGTAAGVSTHRHAWTCTHMCSMHLLLLRKHTHVSPPHTGCTRVRTQAHTCTHVCPFCPQWIWKAWDMVPREPPT